MTADDSLDTPPIRDNPSFKESLDEMEALGHLNRLLPLARPVLKALGADVSKIESVFEDVSGLSNQMTELATMPDRFNDHFAEHGWVMYSLMSFEVAKAAVEAADAQNLERAQMTLVEYYSPDEVMRQLRTMRSINAFRPRIPLAELALTDYQEQRYHACIPVVLAQMDGLVSDLHDRRHGFFSEGIDLSAWDSIAAHDRGLNRLVPRLQESRKTTRSEEISIPYRHGIIHGRDLGYDNRMVAAKTWAALFAVGDWARKAEAGEIEPVEPEPKPGWRDVIDQVRANKAVRDAIDDWTPRDIAVGTHIPADGSPESYDSDSPERALVAFLAYWKAGNYGHMHRSLASVSKRSLASPRAVRDAFDWKELNRYKLVLVDDAAAARTLIVVETSSTQLGESTTQLETFSLIREDKSGNPVVAGEPGGTWGVSVFGPVNPYRPETKSSESV